MHAWVNAWMHDGVEDSPALSHHAEADNLSGVYTIFVWVVKISRKNYLFRICHLFYLGRFKSFQVIFQIVSLRKCLTHPNLPSFPLLFPPSDFSKKMAICVCVCKWFERGIFVYIYQF